jgi:CelD/BcsL family acetyltransferase involved in cellulose biosynthesis
MKINLIPARELDSQLVDIWRNLQESNPHLSSPYFSPEFTQIVAMVRVIEDEGKVVAFFPFQRDGSIGIPIGGILSDFQGMVCKPGFELESLALVKRCGLTAWDFDHLLTSQKCFVQHHRHVESSPQMDLSSGFEAYCAERRAAGSEQIKKTGNLARRLERHPLEREVGPLCFNSHSTDPTVLLQVLSWKSQQYLASLGCDLFSMNWVRETMERIHVAQSRLFSGRLSVLYAGDRLIAGHLGMTTPTVWHYWFPSYDPEFSRYSPGLVLLLKMAEYVPSLGVRVIDLGKGMMLYKQRLMNSSVDVACGSIELPSWLAFRRSARRRFRALVSGSPLAGPARRAVRWIRGRS